MGSGTKITKSFSLDKQLVQEVESSRGPVSASQRVNQLLRTGLEAERRQSLHAEAARFFQSIASQEKRARRAFQAASLKSITRE